MSQRRHALIAAAVVLCVGFARETFAQETDGPPVPMAPVVVTHLLPPPGLLPLAPMAAPPVEAARGRTGQSAFMASLYTSTALMQGLDVHSTLLAFQRGARESNPLMAGIANHRAAFIATKTAVAAATILAARSVAKHNKVAAAVTLVAINSAYAMVVAHNYNVARAGR